jgi:hypothetical protein
LILNQILEQGQEHDRVTLPGQLFDEARLLDDFALRIWHI